RGRHVSATPQELVERALAASTATDCVVIVSAERSVNMRWANNTLTTNGTTTSHDMTVISVVDDAAGRHAASVSRSGVSLDDIADLVAASNAAAASAPPATDAAPLVELRASDDWNDPPGDTAIADFAGITDGLAAAFDAAAA